MAESRDLLFRFLGDARDLASASRSAKSSLGTVDQAQQKTQGGFRNLAGSTKALIAGGAALLASGVVRFLGDAAKSALEDRAAQEQLKVAMQNTVGATDDQIASVEEYIDATARATGVTDNELRPALSELLRATGDTEEAQRRLGESMDIATAKGLPLETVVRAVGKAAQGNVGALGRLGVNVRDAEGGFVDFDTAMSNAADTMGGAMDAAANTAEGRLKRFNIAVDEAKEALGGFVVDGLIRVAEGAEIMGAMMDSSGTQGEQSMRTFEAAVGDVGNTAAGVITVLGTMKGSVEEIMDAADLSASELLKLRDASDEVMLAAGVTEDEIDDLREMIGRRLLSATEDARTHGLVPIESALGDVEDAARGAAEGTQEYADELRAATDPAFAVFDAVNDVREATDKYNEALAVHGEDSIEAMDAARDLAGAYVGLEGAAATYASEGGPESIEAIADLLEEAGVAKDVIDNLRRAIEKYNDTPVANKPIFNPGRGDAGRTGRASHTGGHFGPHGVARVGEKGAETVVFGHSGGSVIPDARAQPAARGGDTIIVQAGFIANEAAVAAEIDKILTRRRRLSGLGFQQ